MDGIIQSIISSFCSAWNLLKRIRSCTVALVHRFCIVQFDSFNLMDAKLPCLEKTNQDQIKPQVFCISCSFAGGWCSTSERRKVQEWETWTLEIERESESKQFVTIRQIRHLKFVSFVSEMSERNGIQNSIKGLGSAKHKIYIYRFLEFTSFLHCHWDRFGFLRVGLQLSKHHEPCLLPASSPFHGCEPDQGKGSQSPGEQRCLSLLRTRDLAQPKGHQLPALLWQGESWAANLWTEVGKGSREGDFQTHSTRLVALISLSSLWMCYW